MYQWLQYPESRLGIPKAFDFGATPSGSVDVNNYSATVGQLKDK